MKVWVLWHGSDACSPSELEGPEHVFRDHPPGKGTGCLTCPAGRTAKWREAELTVLPEKCPECGHEAGEDGKCSVESEALQRLRAALKAEGF